MGQSHQDILVREKQFGGVTTLPELNVDWTLGQIYTFSLKQTSDQENHIAFSSESKITSERILLYILFTAISQCLEKWPAHSKNVFLHGQTHTRLRNGKAWQSKPGFIKPWNSQESCFHDLPITGSWSRVFCWSAFLHSRGLKPLLYQIYLVFTLTLRFTMNTCFSLEG